MARTLAPKTSLFSITFFVDFKSEESSKPRRPSLVPEDCIMRCMDRMTCFSTVARATEILPAFES